jgi:hypothetical protein
MIEAVHISEMSVYFSEIIWYYISDGCYDLKMYTCCNVLRILFTMELYCTQKCNTQLLITVHNSSRILTHVQLLLVL